MSWCRGGVAVMGILSAQGPSALVLFLNVAALAALISLALVLLGRVWPRLAGQAGHLKSVQAAHSRVPPRVGALRFLPRFAPVCLWPHGPFPKG